MFHASAMNCGKVTVLGCGKVLFEKSHRSFGAYVRGESLPWDLELIIQLPGLL